MYFPYLRGKQYDLLALAECATTIAKNGKIIPIIEPVRSKADTLASVVRYCAEESTPFILIVNPQVGELSKNPAPIRTWITNKKLLLHTGSILGYIINQRTTLGNLRAFLNQYAESSVAFVHRYGFSNASELTALFANYDNIKYQIFLDGATGQSYQCVFTDYQRVLIKDGFNKMAKNADYVADEFFSELHNTYQSLGMNGFGDFTAIGKEYSDSGGPAYAVAIHLTHERDTDIWIRHFVSDRTNTPRDTAGKFLEALEKLVAFLNRNPSIGYCRACAQFRDYHLAQHFPQLGPVKRLSIIHHIELMNRVIG